MGMLILDPGSVQCIYAVASAVVVAVVFAYAIWGKRYAPPPAPGDEAEQGATRGQSKTGASPERPGATPSEGGRES